jgi:hypothetical protein
MDHESSTGTLLLATSAVVETIAMFSIGSPPTSGNLLIAAFLLVVPSFVVGYFAQRLGFVYGLILGLMPALFAIAQLPTQVLGLSPLIGASVLFIAYVSLSGFSGAGGAALARRRNAA